MCLGLPALRVSGAWTAPPGRRDFPAQPEPPGHRGPRARPDRQARRGRQITPAFGGLARIDLGIYFRTSGNSSTANGARTFTFYTSEATNFSLTYSSDVSGRSVQTTLDIEKLNRVSG